MLFVENKTYIQFVLVSSSMPTESDAGETIEERILQCVDEGLRALGDGGKKALHYYLEKNLHLKKEDIIDRPDIFWKGLNSIFGEQGANMIGGWIVRKLSESFELDKGGKLSLTEAIAAVKEKKAKSLWDFDCK